MGYMTGSFNLGGGVPQVGDPAMIQFQAVEQFLHRYVVLVPGTWINDALMLTREAGATIEIDGVAVDDMAFSPVGNGDFEVARVSIPDGVHVLDGDNNPFGVVVIGWDQYDSLRLHRRNRHRGHQPQPAELSPCWKFTSTLAASACSA